MNNSVWEENIEGGKLLDAQVERYRELEEINRELNEELTPKMKKIWEDAGLPNPYGL